MKTLAEISGTSFDAKLNSYPSSNAAQRQLLENFQAEFTSISDGFLPGDIFDAFAHWFVAIRSNETTGKSPDVAAAWFARKLFESARAAEFLRAALELGGFFVPICVTDERTGKPPLLIVGSKRLRS
ncbi:MAG: hypothetical protein AABN33_16520 [Acidobacteriota bacterium]